MNLARKKNQIQFKTFETPTAWVVLAIAWRVIDGKVVYSEPKIVRVIQKPETALRGKSASQKSETLLIAGVRKARAYKKLIVSPYSFSYSPIRTGAITWQGARPPTK